VVACTPSVRLGVFPGALGGMLLHIDSSTTSMLLHVS
jgi:hypothetical protein